MRSAAGSAAGPTPPKLAEMAGAATGIEINGVAHVILRANRIAECIAFYDRLMPFLGLRAVPPRSDEFVGASFDPAPDHPVSGRPAE
jgi:hypothetical protein